MMSFVVAGTNFGSADALCGLLDLPPKILRDFLRLLSVALQKPSPQRFSIVGPVCIGTFEPLFVGVAMSLVDAFDTCFPSSSAFHSG